MEHHHDTITICDTRVRLRICADSGGEVVKEGQEEKEAAGGEGAKKSAEEKERMIVLERVPIKRKDLFKLLGERERE